MSAPLTGIKVIHLASLGPGPYAAMLLADLGCEVIVVDRVEPTVTSIPAGQDPRRRGQRSVALDLKSNDGLADFLTLIADCDVLIEGMRPGVAERLGVGPAQCVAVNPRLVYARMTGWGQDGPLAHRAGHDINYIALSGALDAIGEANRAPVVPLNLLGDYAGGGMYLALGVLAAVLDRCRTGLGQVVDAAIIDGVASLTSATMGMLASGRWGARASNDFDGSQPWYRTYRTADDRYLAVGAIEPRFYANLLHTIGLSPSEWPRDTADDRRALADELSRVFGSHELAYWTALFDGVDACVSPVLTFAEAASHPHHTRRGTYLEINGVMQPAPGPRFNRSILKVPTAPPIVGADNEEIIGLSANGGARA